MAKKSGEANGEVVISVQAVATKHSKNCFYLEPTDQKGIVAVTMHKLSLNGYSGERTTIPPSKGKFSPTEDWTEAPKRAEITVRFY